jgi:hypothetical protein
MNIDAKNTTAKNTTAKPQLSLAAPAPQCPTARHHLTKENADSAVSYFIESGSANRAF